MEVEYMAGEKSAPVSGLSDDSKLFGALAYFWGLITGILVFLMKKEDPYCKFHAMQSILLSVGLIVVMVVLMVVQIVLMFIPIVGQILALLLTLVYLVVGLGGLILWLFLMWKAYSGEKFKLPIIGAQAEKMAGSM